jgi:hypothetical protein
MALNMKKLPMDGAKCEKLPIDGAKYAKLIFNEFQVSNLSLRRL